MGVLVLLAAGLAWPLAGRADGSAPAAAAGGNVTTPAAAAPAGGNATVAGGNGTAAASASGGNATTTAPAALSFWKQPYLTGNWGGERDRLNNDGFMPFMNWTGEMWGNANGGIQTGMTQDMLLTWGFGLDLQKIAGWNGVTANATFYWYQGQTPDTNVGAYNSPTSYDAANMVRVFTLYLMKQWLNGRLAVKAGWLTADDTFFQTQSAALFLNAGITAPPSLYGQTLANGDFAVPQYPVATPGVWASYQTLDQRWNFYGAVYDGDSGPNVSHYHGLGVRTGESVLALGEADWHYTVGGTAGVLKAGGYYSGGSFTDWSTHQAQSGIEGAYGMVDQVLWQKKAADGTVQPVLSAYGYAGWAGPQDRVIPQTTYSAGLDWYAPLPSRPSDVAGVAVLYTGFSRAYTASPFNPLGAGEMTAAETDLEFTYQAAITPWFSVQPDAQVIFNPALAKTRATATVVGVRAVVTF
ncbi:MAG: carbohydrate porin [Opitutales bacterium]